MAKNVTLACLQLCSGPDIGKNLEAVTLLGRKARDQGAQFIATPENTCRMSSAPREDRLKNSWFEDAHPGLPVLKALAQELEAWLLVGSLGALKITEEKLANRSYLIAPDGRIVATYDKIHMFDVDLPTGESHRESDLVQPGGGAVVAKTPLFALGMSICYDVRFAALYRRLAQSGAEVLAVPAAFTVPTGQAHWETLLRARAIETGSFVIAPAQTGRNDDRRATWGHSLMIDPWGRVLKDAGKDAGVIVETVDIDAVAATRSAIPALSHDRPFA